MSDATRTRRAAALSLAVAALVWAGPALAGAPAPAPGSTSAAAASIAGPDEPDVQLAHLGAFRFENGEVVDNVVVSYVTHGRLNENRDNVILAMQHFAGDHRDLDFLIGPGKALDTDRYFIVAPDFLGNSLLRQRLTTGPTNSGLKMEFPRYTVRDWVNLEHRLLTEHLGVDRVLAAIGASIGAMKAYQLAVSHPAFVEGIIPITGSPATNPRTRMQLRNMMDIIRLDAGWYGGEYETNPVMAVQTALMDLIPWWYAEDYFATELATPKAYRAFEDHWRNMWRNIAPQDGRDVYYQLRAWAEFDIGDTPGFDGDARAALGSIRAAALLIWVTGDTLVRPDEIALAKAAIPNAADLAIDSRHGHLVCCGYDPAASEVMDRAIAGFLQELVERRRGRGEG